jgi:hypothetical protein
MRAVTVVVRSAGEAFDPVGERLREERRVTREAIHAVEQRDDGTIATLTEVRGDLDRYRAIVDEAASVHEYAVSGDGSGYCYSRVEPTPPLERLVGRSRGEFVVEFPVEVTDDGGHRVTMVGPEGAFASAPAELPDGVEMELVSMGPYRPRVERVFAGLTDRQHEVLATAVRLGYYETPREATHEDVAGELDVEAGTVGKHLRSIESRVFAAYVP